MAPYLANDLLQPQLRRIASASQLLAENSRKYKHSLKSIVRRSFLRPTPTPQGTNVEFPTEEQTLASWALALVEHYTSFDERGSEYCRQRLSTLTLQELNWYKETHDFEHEYVVATIVDTTCGAKRFIRLERKATPPPFTKSQRVQFPSSFSPRKPRMSSISTMSSSSISSSYSQDSSSSSGHSSPASSFESDQAFLQPNDPSKKADVMSVLDRLPDPEKERKLLLMESVTFRPWEDGTPPPTLLDLALIAKSVHDNNDHHLWTTESHWFSTMIVRVLQQAGHCYAVAYRDPALKLQIWMGDMVQLGGGSFKARSVHHEQQMVIEDILLSYQDERDRVMEKVIPTYTPLKTPCTASDDQNRWERPQSTSLIKENSSC